MMMIGLVGVGPDSGGHERPQHSPKVKMGATSVSGRLPPEVIQRIVRQNFGRFRLCYEAGLVRNPNLAGRVVTRFTIDASGGVSQAKSTGTLPDAAVLGCVEKSFRGLAFPQPQSGVVVVSYPVEFVPAGADPRPSSSPAPPPPPPEPPASPAPAPAPTPARSPPPDGPWPIVVMGKDSITSDGKSLVALEPILKRERLQRVDEVFTALKAWREAWKTAHPDVSFPGVAGLRVGASTPMLAVKSVYQTMAFAGFPNLFLQVESDPSRILDLAAIVPGPPDPNPTQAPPPPPKVLHLRIQADRVELLWKVGSEVVTRREVASAELASTFCKDWRENGTHRDASDPRVDHVVVRGDNPIQFRDFADLTRSIEACKRPQRAADGKERSIPAFWMSLSVN